MMIINFIANVYFEHEIVYKETDSIQETYIAV